MFLQQRPQHIGLGRRLVARAEHVAWDGGARRTAIISGVGVRRYYEKLGYRLEGAGCYMVKDLSPETVSLSLSLSISRALSLSLSRSPLSLYVCMYTYSYARTHTLTLSLTHTTHTPVAGEQRGGEGSAEQVRRCRCHARARGKKFSKVLYQWLSTGNILGHWLFR